MDRAELIRFAKESGITPKGARVIYDFFDVPLSALDRFAALVAAAERERCAEAAEFVSPRHTECGNKIAAAIRALP